MPNKPCLYCGNNPVPHFLNWYFESVNVLLSPLRRFLLQNTLSDFLQRQVSKLGLPEKITGILTAGGAITYNHDRLKCKISRAQVLWEEAEKKGITMSELKIFGKPFDTYKAEIPNRKNQIAHKSQILNSNQKLIFSGLPRPRDYDRSALDAMDDKLWLKKKLEKAGLPVPKGGSAAIFFKAKRIFGRVEKPVIVKPRAGSRGRHSITYVSTEAELRKAFRIAKQLCHWVIVEEQLFGPVYRATVIDYRLQGVLRGDSPYVSGDGASTIAELVAQKNAALHPGVKSVIVDEKIEIFLARQQFTLSSVPKTGEKIQLTEKVGLGYGGSSSEDFEICHADNKELFEQAARVVNDPIIGFDFIIEDITKSYKQQRCGFIEANSLPFIDLHHHPLLGPPRNVAKAVWELAENGEKP